MLSEQHMFHDCDELVPGWLNFVKGVVEQIVDILAPQLLEHVVEMER